MAENHYGGHIKEIKFNDNTTLELEQDDIVVFVGPNNSGKSQSLKDIYSLLKNSESRSVVVSQVKIVKEDVPTEDFLENIAFRSESNGDVWYSIFGHSFRAGPVEHNFFLNMDGFNTYNDLFCVRLGTSERLSICEPADNIARNAPKTHPIHFAAFNRERREWLSSMFEKAFGYAVIPNIHFGSKIPLCIGDRVIFGEEYDGIDEQERTEAYAAILEGYDQVQEQGDGIKSFIGILLYLMLDYYRVYLIDEPESFLHPPQARIMGQIIGDTLSNTQQAFISTHSEDIIKGLMDKSPNRVKVVRITREEADNGFSILGGGELQNIWRDPLLKNSNIVSGLFYKNTVLCESDSDCKFYAIIDARLKEKDSRYPETLFIHCGGKYRVAKVVGALSSLGIKVKIISDMDLLNDKDTLREVVGAIGIEWDLIKEQYKIFADNLSEPDTELKREDVRGRLDEILNEKNDEELSKKDIKALQKVLKLQTKWSKIKEEGVSAISDGASLEMYRELDSIFRDSELYLVPVGELEGFVDNIGGQHHGPSWVNKVLETYPDLDDEVYDKVKIFISQLRL